MEGLEALGGGKPLSLCLHLPPLLYPMDNHHVDPAGLDVGKQACQRRPVHVAAGEAALPSCPWPTSPGFCTWRRSAA